MSRYTNCGSRLSFFATACLGLIACSRAPSPASTSQTSAASETPAQFVARVNHDLEALDFDAGAAAWTHATYINADTQELSAKNNERYLEALSKAAEDAKRFDGQKLSTQESRAILQIRLNVSAPAPPDAARRAELAELGTHLESLYGEGKYCPPGKGKDSCQNLDQLSRTLARSRDYATLTEAWKGWHDVGASMRSDYQRFVELANEGAQALGYKDLGVLWRAGYDMSPEDFDKESERLWQQVKPLYQELHCYARVRLAKKYGADKVPAGQPIPAHLLGNMWAQQWNNIYEDLLKPYPGASIQTADHKLQQQKWDAMRMTRSAESFYTSLGLPQLPPKFWERSMLVRPRDREVICHASAWDMGEPQDFRIKACLTPTEEDLDTVYHEMGHIYYYIEYQDQPYLFRGGAHDGFHEAIGDTVNLSVTPAYLAKIGLVDPVKPGREAVINQQMKMALDKIAFLPFGRLIDQWRWKVFSGEIKPADYNKSWWELRRKYQGIVPPVARTESDFDPGAKYHVPANTPYTRYFLSFILQFQLQKGLCAAAGNKGPLFECSIYGSEAAGRKFADMLKVGASEPWQDTLEKLTGTRQMDASAIIEYFGPLLEWLKKANEGQQCGWPENDAQT